MTKVHRCQSAKSGAFTPISLSLRPCDQDIQTEQPNTEGAPAAPWANNQDFESNPDLDADFQFETLLDSFQPETENVPFVEMKLEEVMMGARQPAAAAAAAETPPLAPPASPESSDGSYHQQGGAVPRHKRPSHKRAELKRRDKIKTRLEELKDLIPSIADKGKMSEVAILSKAAEHKKHLSGDCEKFSTEAGNLRQEIESLSTEIHSLQEQLPAAGLKQETVEKSQRSLDKMYDDYCSTSTHDNWKFYLFNFISKPLFQSFKEDVAKDTVESFKTCLEKWTNDRLSLANLRHQTFESVRGISRKTSIMTNPASLPEQALASIARPMDTAATTSAPSGAAGQLFAPVVSSSGAAGQCFAPVVSSSGGAGQLFAPIVSSSGIVHRPASKGVSAPPFCDVNQLSATLVPPSSSISRLSGQVICVPSSSGAGQLISSAGVHQLVSAAPSSCVSQFNAVPSSSGVSQLISVHSSSGVSQLISAPSCSGISHLVSAPSCSGISHLVSAVPSSKHMERPHLYTPVTLGLSSSDGGHWSTPVTSSTPLSSSMARQSATRPTVAPFAQPHLYSSLPSTQSQNPSLESFSPVIAVPQGLVPPQFSPPACKVSTSMEDEGHGRNHHRWSKPAARASSRKRSTSGLNASGAAAERGAAGDESQPVLRKRESLDRPSVVTQPPPISGFVPPVQRASQRSVESVQVDTSDISQLAASVEGTSLYVNPPVAVVTPLMAHQEPTSVAHLLTGSQYHEYDFDITDILLPDL